MNFEIRISNLISENQHELELLDSKKYNAATISLQRQYILEMERKSSYIQGLKDALFLIQSKDS